MARALARFAQGVSALSGAAGRAASWLYPLLVAVLLVNVTLRYGLGLGALALEELQWHLFAAAFLLGFAWVESEDGHVRVDLLRERLPRRVRAAVDLAGSLLLLFPFAVIVAVSAWDFAWQSWLLGERSPLPSGLPARWVPKGVLAVALSLLALQALASAARSAAALARPRSEGG